MNLIKLQFRFYNDNKTMSNIFIMLTIFRNDERVTSGSGKKKKSSKMKVNKEWATKKYYFRWKEKVLGQGMDLGAPGNFEKSLETI